ncbi:Class II abasic (AP) endonuclease [Tilletia horrida]|nr:Class II abasic (AP) endonuclease [Tilletia horrida]
MRIVSFNVNGLRTLRGYQPWYSKKDFEECLDFLQGDIVCFQETKMTRKQLDRSLAILPSFHSFFNFHPTKGYSGTAVYVRKTVSIPTHAECGITGEWLPSKATGTGNDGSIIGGIPKDAKDELDAQLWRSLDLEGRSVVIDCGLFVLFNLYCPNLTGPERAEYKQAFNRVLGERANRLVDEGREVIIVGDLNICYQPIDHADPEQSLKDHGITEFGDTPGRKWLRTMLDLSAGGRFIDAARHFHPTRTKMFTCWNQKIDARPANYGTRIDFTLISKGLEGWLKGADIQADIYGSDHCPVYVELLDEREIDGRKVKLRDLMHGWDPEKEPAGPSTQPPPLAACNEEEFSDKRRSIASFFTASAAKTSTGSVKSGLSASQQAVAAASTSQTTPTPGPETPADLGADGLSAADAFSALRSMEASRAEGDAALPVESKEGSNQPAQTAVPPQPPTQTASEQSERDDTSANAASIVPAPLVNTESSASKSKSAQKKPLPAKGKSNTKKIDDRQQTLAGFFSKGSKPSPKAETLALFDKLSPAGSLPSSDRASASQATQEPPESPSSLRGTQEGSGAEDDPDSAAKRVGTALAWGSIFTAPPAPKCGLHGETAKAWTVNKPGKNHGRKFWLCARPVGPGYEKSGRDRQDVNPEYRCDYFVWDSDLRANRAAQSASVATASSSSSSTSSSTSAGSKRSAAAATLSDVSRARQRKEASEPVSPHKRAKPSI